MLKLSCTILTLWPLVPPARSSSPGPRDDGDQGDKTTCCSALLKACHKFVDLHAADILGNVTMTVSASHCPNHVSSLQSVRAGWQRMSAWSARCSVAPLFISHRSWPLAPPSPPGAWPPAPSSASRNPRRT